jgi:hypothetical protein
VLPVTWAGLAGAVSLADRARASWTGAERTCPERTCPERTCPERTCPEGTMTDRT